MPQKKTKNVPTIPFKVKKRDSRIVDFDKDRVTTSIFKAADSVGGDDRKRAQEVADESVKRLIKKYSRREYVKTTEIAEVVKDTLIEMGHGKTSVAFDLFLQLRNQIKNIKSLIDADSLIKDYIDMEDWRIKENSNMSYSWQGLNNHISTSVQANYWLHSIYPKNISNAHINCDLHLHDLGMLATYCCGWSLEDLLIRGFTGVPGKLSCAPPKHLRTALGQIVNFLYTLQHEAAGAQAFSSFDTYLAPFVRYDGLKYEEVKQAMQEFLFNMNVPTRVGCQCVSEDTEILTPDGWKSYRGIKEGSTIKTFNLESKEIEDQVVTSVYKGHHKGVMYNLKNRIQDQLISPKHRVVRKAFNSNKYILEPIEDVFKLKSPIIIPITGDSINPSSEISNEQIQLMAWIIADGTLEVGRGTNRVSIYQSKIKKKKNYNEIKALINYFNLKFDESETVGLGNPVKRIRLCSESSKIVHKWFDNDSNIKFIPNSLMNLDTRQSKLFLETYIKGDGFDNCKISTTNIEVLNRLQAIAVNAGYGSTVLTRKPTLGNKDIYILRLIDHQDTYIQKIKKVQYDGLIWCPHTVNETIIARRNGKVFITGNTPFTNITLDLKPHGMLANESVIIGGKPQKDTFGDFQEEMDMINKAFCEVMLEGDAQGRLFSFPIPTYNLTKDFEWENPKYDKLWEMTAKYGIPYFCNFINSDMSPDDVRSMCCRLKIDNRELRKRGGGLFGANPLTGSIGVVTINMARIGYLAKDEKEYFEMLNHWMDVAKESLVIRREFVEKYMQKGLYPYSKFYLDDIAKRFGEYFKNHFNTIGLLGLNESIVNFYKEENIATEKGKEFGLKVMDYMRDKLMDYQTETNQLFNLEATPGEGTTYRFAKSDKKKFGNDIITGADLGKTKSKDPYYTNSSQLPVGYTDDVWEALDLQDEFQTKYTGGTVLHIFLGEKMPSVESTRAFVKKVAENYTLPYFSITPTFSICPKHGYISGEHEFCPKCDAEVGYEEGMEFIET